MRDLQLPSWVGVELDGELSAGFDELGMLIKDDAALRDKMFGEWRQFQRLSDVMVAMEGNIAGRAFDGVKAHTPNSVSPPPDRNGGVAPR
jgi:hypothetical protein